MLQYIILIDSNSVKGFSHADFIFLGENIGAYTRYDGQSDLDFSDELYSAAVDLARIEQTFISKIFVKLS